MRASTGFGLKGFYPPESAYLCLLPLVVRRQLKDLVCSVIRLNEEKDYADHVAVILHPKTQCR